MRIEFFRSDGTWSKYPWPEDCSLDGWYTRIDLYVSPFEEMCEWACANLRRETTGITKVRFVTPMSAIYSDIITFVYEEDAMMFRLKFGTRICEMARIEEYVAHTFINKYAQ